MRVLEGSWDVVTTYSWEFEGYRDTWGLGFKGVFPVLAPSLFENKARSLTCLDAGH